jgi:hypothetical protein
VLMCSFESLQQVAFMREVGFKCRVVCMAISYYAYNTTRYIIFNAILFFSSLAQLHYILPSRSPPLS